MTQLLTAPLHKDYRGREVGWLEAANPHTYGDVQTYLSILPDLSEFRTVIF